MEPRTEESARSVSAAPEAARSRVERGLPWERLVELFLALGSEPRRNIEELTKLAGELLGAACAFYNRLEGERLCAWGAWQAPLDYVGDDRPDGRMCHDVLRAGREEPLVLRDLPRSVYATSDPNVARCGLQTYVGCAVRAEGYAVGSLCALFLVDTEPSPEELRMLRAVGNAIALEETRRQQELDRRGALDHFAQAEGALRRSRQLLAAVLESTADGLLAVDAGGKVVAYNEKFLTLWGLEAQLTGAHEDAALVGAVWRRVKDPEGFRRRIEQLYAEPMREAFDTVELTDGRVFERYSTGFVVEGSRPGRVWSFRDITRRTRGEASRALLATAVEQAGDGVMISDVDGVVRYVNPMFERITGLVAAEVLGKDARAFLGGDAASFAAGLPARGTVLQPWSGHVIATHKNGSRIDLEVIIAPVREPGGSTTNFVALAHDTTRERHLEEEIRQAQKMEAVGRLAGGIAHDFNNLLTAITASSGFVLEELGSDDPLREDVLEIQRAAERAAALTHQLLAFSRRQVLVAKVVDLNEILRAMEKMLGRLIGEDVEIRTALAARPTHVKVDPGQLEQVIVNLCVNARDAMPSGGAITLKTRPRVVGADERFGDEPARPGRYVELSVEDVGTGMDEATRRRIFEPFFTTKERGKGTGLGLATVFGIVKQSGGAIDVETALGRGTTFRIVLPMVEEEAPVGGSKERAKPASGSETILVVEDEDSVRRVVVRQLTRAGYRVLEARDGIAALEVIAKHGGPVDLLLTDVVMPRKNGPELARELLQARQVRCVLFTTGYTDAALPGEQVPQKAAVLRKPYEGGELLGKVRELLDAAPRA